VARVFHGSDPRLYNESLFVAELLLENLAYRVSKTKRVGIHRSTVEYSEYNRDYKIRIGELGRVPESRQSKVIEQEMAGRLHNYLK
jgi:hypothetical protein